tara:strand:+ start:140 stop:385 length:246 start_codon:yes stop_codon:yes gene_type:complete
MNLEAIAVFIMMTLAIILLIREVICWYFKINKRVELQEKILAELVKVNKSNNLVVSGGGINSPSTITDTDEPILNAYSKGL